MTRSFGNWLRDYRPHGPIGNPETGYYKGPDPLADLRRDFLCGCEYEGWRPGAIKTPEEYALYMDNDGASDEAMAAMRKAAELFGQPLPDCDPDAPWVPYQRPRWGVHELTKPDRSPVTDEELAQAVEAVAAATRQAPLIRWQGLVPPGNVSAPGNFDGYLDQVALSMRWLRLMEPRKRIRTDAHSYHLKHVVEYWQGRYIANGSFIVAAISMGFPWKPCGPGDLNAWIGMDPTTLQSLERRMGPSGGGLRDVLAVEEIAQEERTAA
jgi:hypothetical protein